MAFGKGGMENSRDLAERAFGGRRVKRADIDQVNRRGTKGFGTAKTLADIEAGLELVEDQHELVLPRLRQDIALTFFLVPQQHLSSRLFFTHNLP